MFGPLNNIDQKAPLKRQLNFLYRLEKALFQDSDESTRLKFNVLGHLYEIPVSILNNYPNTLLGEPKLRASFYDFRNDEFVFDRHPQAFESIITFYESDGNSLAKPEWMPSEMFYEELKFFQLNSSTLIAFYDQEIAPMIDLKIVPKHRIRRILWLLLNYSTFDWRSQLMHAFDFTINLAALWTLIQDCSNNHSNSTILYWIEENNRKFLRPIYLLLDLRLSTMFIELFCTVVFLLEMTARIFCSPTFHQIYSDLCFWFECISIIPNIVLYIFISTLRSKQLESSSILSWITGFRLLRVLRFTRQITGFKIFLRSLMYSVRELQQFFIILIAATMFFGEFIYLIEEWTSGSSIETVTDGYWLTALTITSLGYGDLYPTHLHSRILMSICSIIGLVLVALPIPRLYRYFYRFYQVAKRKRRIVRFIFDKQKALRI